MNRLMRDNMAKAAALAFGSCLITLLALPAAVTAQSFDCRKATTKAEKMICADTAISKLDEQMADRYKKLLDVRSEQKAQIVAQQARWLKEQRNVAADAAHLKAHYDQRISELDAALAQAPSPAVGHAQMFDAKGNIIGSQKELQCRELSVFDAKFKRPDLRGEGTYLIGLFGMGYLHGYFKGIADWSASGPSELEKKNAEKLFDDYLAFPLSIGIIDANVRAFCSMPTNETKTILDALQVLVVEISK